MSVLVIYFSLGLVISLGLHGLAWRGRRGRGHRACAGGHFKGAAAPVGPARAMGEPQRLRWRSALRWVGLWALWPLALGQVGPQRWGLTPEPEAAPLPPEFAVRWADLVAPHDLAEVEARAVVHDPLGAVPDVPFGHLFMLWRTFKRRAPQGAALWSFEAVWDAGWGGLRRQAGYAWVQDQGVVDFVVIDSRPMRSDELMSARLGPLDASV